VRPRPPREAGRQIVHLQFGSTAEKSEEYLAWRRFRTPVEVMALPKRCWKRQVSEMEGCWWW
jgi:hypothetical protein